MALLRFRNAGIMLRRLASDVKFDQKAIEKHASETATTWKMVSFLVGFPTCGYLFYKHIIQGEEHHEAKDWVPYDHMRIRHTPFPWGDESLFHNKHMPGPNRAVEDNEEHKENVITAFIRKLRDDHSEKDWKVQVEMLEFCHQKMLEHIERKKFVQTPPMPRYSRFFAYPAFDLQDPRHRLPAGVDD